MVSLSVASSANNVCATPGCIQSALNVLSDVDFNVDPCSDFYQYTCGGWLKNATIPDSESSIGTFYHLRDANLEIIEKILTTENYEDLGLVTTGEEEKEADQSNFSLVKSFFQSCMDEDTLNKLGTRPLEDFLTTLQNDDMMDTLVRLELIGASNPLFSANVNPDEKNPNQNVITLLQPPLGLPSKEYFQQKDLMNVYRETMKTLARLVIPGLGDESIDRIVDFETQLASISSTLEDLQNPLESYNPVTLKDLEHRYAFFDWRQFFDKVTASTIPEKVILATPGYFDSLAKLWTETNGDLIKDYILLASVRQTVHLVDKATTDLLEDVNSKLTGRKTTPPRVRTCIHRTNEAFGDLLGHYFINLAFADHDSTSQKVQEQLNAIHDIYAQRLATIDWLDESTRKTAMDKIKKMTIKSMYSTVSPDIRSPLSLKTYYEDVAAKIKPDTQFDNNLAIATWMASEKWASLNQPVDKDKWFMVPQVVNAYFTPTFNQVVVPAGILQPPFFDMNSVVLSLGGIGVVIGHELTHGFDNNGRLYDGDGVLTQWWSDETMEKFNNKAQCFIDQYNGFSIQGPDGQDHHVNGKMTLGENMADNGGISLAYEAFSKNRQLRLSGMDVSPEALFFINFGRVWCEKTRPERAIQKILGDVHSPARVRVNAAVQNMPEFAKAFNCPANAPMNPTNKCKLW